LLTEPLTYGGVDIAIILSQWCVYVCMWVGVWWCMVCYHDET